MKVSEKGQQVTNEPLDLSLDDRGAVQPDATFMDESSKNSKMKRANQQCDNGRKLASVVVTKPGLELPVDGRRDQIEND